MIYQYKLIHQHIYLPVWPGQEVTSKSFHEALAWKLGGSCDKWFDSLFWNSDLIHSKYTFNRKPETAFAEIQNDVFNLAWRLFCRIVSVILWWTIESADFVLIQPQGSVMATGHKPTDSQALISCLADRHSRRYPYIYDWLKRICYFFMCAWNMIASWL